MVPTGPLGRLELIRVADRILRRGCLRGVGAFRQIDPALTYIEPASKTSVNGPSFTSSTSMNTWFSE